MPGVAGIRRRTTRPPFFTFPRWVQLWEEALGPLDERCSNIQAFLDLSLSTSPAPHHHRHLPPRASWHLRAGSEGPAAPLLGLCAAWPTAWPSPRTCPAAAGGEALRSTLTLQLPTAGFLCQRGQQMQGLSLGYADPNTLAVIKIPALLSREPVPWPRG